MTEKNDGEAEILTGRAWKCLAETLRLRDDVTPGVLPSRGQHAVENAHSSSLHNEKAWPFRGSAGRTVARPQLALG